MNLRIHAAMDHSGNHCHKPPNSKLFSSSYDWAFRCAGITRGYVMKFCRNQCRVAAVVTACSIVTLFMTATAAPVRAATIVVNFDSLDASAPGGLEGAPVAAYLANYGISVSGNPLVVYDVRNLVDHGVEFTAPASRPNFLGGSASPQTNTLTFAEPLDELRFTRNALIVTGPGGTTHPEWSATAFDAMGNILHTVGEPLIATFTDFPLKQFTLQGPLHGPKIASVRFHSDNQNFAGYGAVILDDLTLVRIPEPVSLAMAGQALLFAFAAVGVRRRMMRTNMVSGRLCKI